MRSVANVEATNAMNATRPTASAPRIRAMANDVRNVNVCGTSTLVNAHVVPRTSRRSVTAAGTSSFATPGVGAPGSAGCVMRAIVVGVTAHADGTHVIYARTRGLGLAASTAAERDAGAEQHGTAGHDEPDVETRERQRALRGGGLLRRRARDLDLRLGRLAAIARDQRPSSRQSRAS